MAFIYRSWGRSCGGLRWFARLLCCAVLVASFPVRAVGAEPGFSETSSYLYEFFRKNSNDVNLPAPKTGGTGIPVRENHISIKSTGEIVYSYWFYEQPTLFEIEAPVHRRYEFFIQDIEGSNLSEPQRKEGSIRLDCRSGRGCVKRVENGSIGSAGFVRIYFDAIEGNGERLVNAFLHLGSKSPPRREGEVEAFFSGKR